GADADCPQRWGFGYRRPQDLCRRRRGDDHGTRRRVSSRRGLRPGDEFVDLAALHADAASRRRRRGDRQSFPPGERDDPVGRRADLPRPDALHPHRDARHPRVAVRFGSVDDRRAERRGAAGPRPVNETEHCQWSIARKETFMSKVFKRGTAMLALMIASVAFITTAHAQMPASPWKKGAPFPVPDEELYGVEANGKLYVIGGWDDGKAAGVTYEYDPATDKWTKKQPMPKPAHHAALAAANGKIYVMGGFVAPSDTALPLGAAWQPIDNAWQYDPVADAWKSLPPLPTKRGSAVAAEVGGKIYTIGGATTMEGRVLNDSTGRLESKDPFFTAFGPSRVLSVNEVYDPATNKWETRKSMSVPRNHAFSAAVNGKIYVIGGRTGQGFILTATNTDVDEEYAPLSDSWNAPKERMPTARSGGVSGTDGRRIYVAGGEVTTQELVGAF